VRRKNDVSAIAVYNWRSKACHIDTSVNAVAYPQEIRYQSNIEILTFVKSDNIFTSPNEDRAVFDIADIK